MKLKYLLLILIISLGCLFLVNIPKWQYISLQNAYEKPYDINVYNCSNFSEDLVKKLNNAGYDAEMVISKDAKDGYCSTVRPLYEKYVLERKAVCHGWVIIKGENYIIPIESTNGFGMTIEQHNLYAYGTVDGNNEWLYLKEGIIETAIGMLEVFE